MSGSGCAAVGERSSLTLSMISRKKSRWREAGVAFRARAAPERVAALETKRSAFSMTRTTSAGRIPSSAMCAPTRGAPSDPRKISGRGSASSTLADFWTPSRIAEKTAAASAKGPCRASTAGACTSRLSTPRGFCAAARATSVSEQSVHGGSSRDSPSTAIVWLLRRSASEQALRVCASSGDCSASRHRGSWLQTPPPSASASTPSSRRPLTRRPPLTTLIWMSMANAHVAALGSRCMQGMTDADLNSTTSMSTPTPALCHRQRLFISRRK